MFFKQAYAILKTVNKKKLVLAVGIILLLGLIGLGRNLWPQKKDPAALKIETTPQATVFFNDNHVGQTPYSVQNLPPGPLSVKLATDNQNWSTKVNLTSGAWTIIRRDFGATEASSSGEILSLEKGTGLIIISAPDKASVVIDGQSVGETPLVLKDFFTGLIKSFAFATIICIVACFQGMNTEGGAEGVGLATTRAVVTTFIMIIAADCFFTALFYFMFP